MVCSTESEAIKVDFILRKISVEEKTHIKYTSFKCNSSNERVSGLKLNLVINTKLRYKWLEDTSAIDNARLQEK